jgi:uncharacterized protein YbaR (Trm112 family)
MNTIPAGYAVCPCCKGTKRVPLLEEQRRYAHVMAGYDKETDTLTCNNCGGQTMFGQSIGYSKKRNPEDIEGCKHEFSGRNAGRCYTIYTCKHCNSSYDIDSNHGA